MGYVGSYAPTPAAGASLAASVTAAAGDVLLYMAWTGYGTQVPQAPTGGGLTWSLVMKPNSTDTSGNAQVVIYSATSATAQTFTLTGTVTGDTLAWGWQVQRWSGVVVGANKWGIPGSTSAQISWSQSNVGSAFPMIIADYNAVDGASRTYVTASAGPFTETLYGRDQYATRYLGFYANSGAAGTKTVGISAPTGQLSAIAVAELLPAGRVIDRWSGTALIRQSVQRWNGSALTTRIIEK